MSYDVTIEFDGDRHHVDVADDEYILDAGLDAGLDLPFSCREGNCTTCTGKLLSGTVDQSEGTALEKPDREEGYVLLCSAYPRDECSVQAGEGVQEELLGLDVF